MPEGVFLGWDYGFKRIGVAVGQMLTCSATPLPTIKAQEGVPDWHGVTRLIKEWNPQALIVGLPTCIDDSELFTTSAARQFAQDLKSRYGLPVHLVDERLSTVEARGQLFAQGGYKKIKKSAVDGIAACVILEQWLQYPNDSL
ncbi:MAG: Holliday junction DNA helicase RuvA [Legionella sp. 40-6]|nr:Holliday junction resolvase RuvX [Legionella sp.]OJY30954.1 MAG: Holliday junction DNA helicase RuvA [Legionella sp. 40-6]